MLEGKKEEANYLVKVVSLFFIFLLLAGCASSSFGIYHTVGRDQTLWRISKAYEVELQELAELNNILDPEQIKAGQKIFIPGVWRKKRVESYIPQNGEKGKSPDNVENKEEEKGTLLFEKDRFIWPVKGVIIEEFGIRDGYRNNGLDIAAPKGTPVLASDDGEVIYADNNLKGYGKIIIVKHKEGFTTLYANNHKNLVKVGDKVKKGDEIANVGNSVRNLQYSLHLEIRKNGKPRNPLFFLP